MAGGDLARDSSVAIGPKEHRACLPPSGVGRQRSWRICHQAQAYKDAAKGLKSRVNFLDATGIFDRESAAVYIDDCCHYTLRGNQLLADAIARQILNSKGPGDVLPAASPSRPLWPC